MPTYPFAKIRCWLELTPSIPKIAKEANLSTAVDELQPSLSSLTEFATQYLQKIFASVLKIPPAELLPNKTYEAFGIESVNGLEIIATLENDFGELSKTLLFEHNKIRTLTQYLINSHKG